MSEIYRSPEGEALLRAAYARIRAAWPTAHESLRLPTRQGETFVIACGPAEAPPLVLLHGAGANSAMWMGDVAAWAEHFRVYAVDVIGEPGESAPSRPPRDGPAYAEWLDDVLDGLGAPRAALVGISLGGWLALDYAIRRPARVSRLALICPGGVGRVKLSFLVGAMLMVALGPIGRRLALASAGGGAVRPEVAAYMALIFTHFRPRRDKLPQFSDAALRAVAAPALVILGGKDSLLDSHQTRRRVGALMPGAEVLFLPEAGHFIFGQTAPVLDFLRAGG
jgi:pimeloyl-ACP methyl ester carboxylesterase